MFADFILVRERPLDNPKDEYTCMALDAVDDDELGIRLFKIPSDL